MMILFRFLSVAVVMIMRMIMFIVTMIYEFQVFLGKGTELGRRHELEKMLQYHMLTLLLLLLTYRKPEKEYVGDCLG